jgi:hypothetical protein
MKMPLIMTGALLALTASIASATGIDLNWNQCLNNAARRVQDQSFTCVSADPNAPDANLQQFNMYGSVRTGVNILGVKSWQADVDIQVANATLDPWWDMVSGGCRQGSLGFVFVGFPSSEISGCNGGLMNASPAALGASNYIEGAAAPPSGAGGANRARFSMLVSRTSGITAVGTTKYALFKATLDSRFTEVDPNDPQNGDHACAGCLDQACLVLNHVNVQTDPTQTSDGNNHFYTQEIADFITWQGGTIGGSGCPAATPTKKATWGQVKSLYR